MNPDTIAEKLAIVADARSRGRTTAKAALIGWSRATLYRHHDTSILTFPGRSSAAADNGR